MNDRFSFPNRGNGLFLFIFSLTSFATPVLLADQKPASRVDKDHAAKMARGLALFKEQVRPVLIKNCLRCHGGKATESEFDLHDRDGLLKGGTTGPAIVPGKARDSLLLRLVRHEKEPHMPQGSAKLSDSTIRYLADWIDLGAPYDRSLLDKEDVAAWTRKIVPAEARQFWSFRPLHRVDPPQVKNETRVRTTVDRFILSKLETAGIAPNDSVERRQLLRRASLDLIGLPPTPEEVDAFLKTTRAMPSPASSTVCWHRHATASAGGVTGSTSLALLRATASSTTTIAPAHTPIVTSSSRPSTRTCRSTPSSSGSSLATNWLPTIRSP